MTDLVGLENQIIAQIDAANDEQSLEETRVSALGKKGVVSEQMKSLGKMSPEEKKEMGPKLNGLKERINAAIVAKKDILKRAALEAKLATETVDVTLPLKTAAQDAGRIHPISQVWEEVTTIFAQMGFASKEGPDIETEYYNFDALNMPPSHPARQMMDTFFLNDQEDGKKRLLRTHTSPVQIRTMIDQAPPIRIIAPGRVYRCDYDPTHTPMFHQVEGLVIDKGSHMGHLKWVLETFLKSFFEVDSVKLRFRPSYFPFTEPSMEVDVGCQRVGNELRIGEGDDWLEILGCGMVNPNVLRSVDLDPDVYQGFAWGIGIDRITMLKYGMPDLRAFFDGDTRWAKHYGFKALDVPSLTGGLSR